jgi:hypothetical protein
VAERRATAATLQLREAHTLVVGIAKHAAHLEVQVAHSLVGVVEATEHFF